MSPTPSPLASGSESARPVGAGERVVLLDTLRGFALCGVLMANVYLWFSGRMFLSRAQFDAAMKDVTWLDTVVNHAFGPLIGGRFITLFSVLFGLGFAVQLGRAEHRGASVVPVYTRRLVVMLGLGLAHLFLLFQGDIVSTYALLGFTLLLFYRRSDRALLAWATALIFLAPVLVSVALRLPQWLGGPEALEAAKAANEHRAGLRAQVLEAFMHGSFADTVRSGAAYYVGDLGPMLATFWPVIIGRFLLGLWAGRRRLFHDAPQHLPFFRRLLAWSLGLGLFASGVGVLVGQLFSRKVLSPDGLPWLPFVMGPLRHLGEMGMAAAYAAAITLLFQRDTWRRRLAVFAPVGQMALTNYLMQSVLGVLLFYGCGLGLMGRLGSAAQLAVALGIFALQAVFSRLWLARFRFGPAEWLTRSLTYGRAQPLRRAPAGDEVANA
ncbi:DUF418 domain-containing protein [Pyxidicoccus fallax]|uniref:DUF418 domain-containing protein n=1 Tax=Pyxidicoccus fallax TaxID=394095 RepID=A0A848L6J4_9BACT|nr:DUF418 domain-containing protein [Pyxidicoccus fallax]NMO14274.1 DUF418 domain-containing protein [Pyxidicoccus fallax]NPC79921.1 DUF418 domain-containing protein [Pyxidicoccus fallax]